MVQETASLRAKFKILAPRIILASLLCSAMLWPAMPPFRSYPNFAPDTGPAGSRPR